LLAAADIRHIDFFSLDVQGAELSVLKTMDWSIPVEILLVELDGSDRQKDMWRCARCYERMVSISIRGWGFRP
jgi:hypothetical protein